jgi:transcriptional regulator GlxA family with amidase domain
MIDTLTQLDPTIEPRPDDRYVDDGDVITAAGVSAGIDMALHLVRRLAGADRARAVRRGIQYDPSRRSSPGPLIRRRTCAALCAAWASSNPASKMINRQRHAQDAGSRRLIIRRLA